MTQKDCNQLVESWPLERQIEAVTGLIRLRYGQVNNLTMDDDVWRLITELRKGNVRGETPLSWLEQLANKYVEQNITNSDETWFYLTWVFIEAIRRHQLDPQLIDINNICDRGLYYGEQWIDLYKEQ